VRKEAPVPKETAAAPALSAQGLQRSYGGRAVVEDFTTVVERGCVTVLVGPNGCGKTTSVEMAVGLRRADAGSAFIGGFDVHRDSRRASRLVGVALQGASLNERVRVREHLDFFAALYESPTATGQIAELLGLDAQIMRSFYGTLSGGQQRRVLVAAALTGAPTLAILDEPTSGVDIESRMDLWDALRTVQESTGTAFLVTTHDLNEAGQYADQVLVMRSGRIAFDGSPSDFARSTPMSAVVSIKASSALNRATLPVAEGDELRGSARELTVGFASQAGSRAVLDWAERQDSR
jgi:ABC-2 type transport system ATP-binding protein